MKEFECKSCKKKWFVAPDLAGDVVGCPFCLKELPKHRVVVVDSFESAVLKVVDDYGVEVVSDKKRFLSYLSDVAYDYRREVKILSNACDSRVFTQFYELSLCELDEAKVKLQQIQQYLVDEEGIAEGWAKRICECIMCAIHEDFNVEIAKTASTNLPVGMKKGQQDKTAPTARKKQKNVSKKSDETSNHEFWRELMGDDFDEILKELMGEDFQVTTEGVEENDSGTILSAETERQDSEATQSDAIISQDEIDRLIRNVKKTYYSNDIFTYSNAREYRDISTGTLIIPRGFTKIADNAIDGLSIRHIYFPSTMIDIPERIFKVSSFRHVYVESGNRRYASFHDGKEMIDMRTKETVYKVK